MPSVTPSIIKGYHISWAPYSASAPTEESAWTELKNCIRSMPNFFPDPDTVDTSTVDNLTPTSIPGWTAGEAYSFTVAPTYPFFQAHMQMVEEQSDSAKGYFWLRIDLTNRGQRLEGKFTTVDYLPTPEGNAGDLDEISWNVYSQSDLIPTEIPQTGE